MQSISNYFPLVIHQTHIHVNFMPYLDVQATYNDARFNVYLVSLCLVWIRWCLKLSDIFKFLFLSFNFWWLELSKLASFQTMAFWLLDIVILRCNIIPCKKNPSKHGDRWFGRMEYAPHDRFEEVRKSVFQGYKGKGSKNIYFQRIVYQYLKKRD